MSAPCPQVCLPTIEKDCAPVALKQREVTGQEKCVEVARTVCTEVGGQGPLKYTKWV